MYIGVGGNTADGRCLRRRAPGRRRPCAQRRRARNWPRWRGFGSGGGALRRDSPRRRGRPRHSAVGFACGVGDRAATAGGSPWSGHLACACGHLLEDWVVLLGGGRMNLDAARRAYAEELQARARLRNEALVRAFAKVPREHFLGLARGSSCCRRRLPVDEQFDAVRWLLDELPALADLMQDAIFDFEDARDARPPLQLVKS